MARSYPWSLGTREQGSVISNQWPVIGRRKAESRNWRVEGSDRLVAIGGSWGVVGLELGGFALEGGVEGRELRNEGETEKLKR